MLPWPELNGGNKVIALHAALLQQAGFQVTVAAEGPRPGWMPYNGPYLDLSTKPRLLSQDLIIATFWTTLTAALQAEAGPVAHFCQGYEGRLTELRSHWPQIEVAYAPRVPTFTVTPDLAAYLAARFGRTCRVVPPPVDPLFRPSLRWRPRARPWIAAGGLFEAPVKGVRTALAAVSRLRASGRACRLFRFSTSPLSSDERALLEPDRYLTMAPPHDIARALRRCDLLLFTSRIEEGFGLPLLEAMASGVPAVASRTPSTLFMTQGAVTLVAPHDDEAFAAEAARLLADSSRWRRARRAGLETARRFDAREIQPVLIDAVRWAAGCRT
jgi:glycosyltransferase involved in cell wall biosynthesis